MLNYMITTRLRWKEEQSDRRTWRHGRRDDRRDGRRGEDGDDGGPGGVNDGPGREPAGQLEVDQPMGGGPHRAGHVGIGTNGSDQRLGSSSLHPGVQLITPEASSYILGWSSAPRR